MEIKQVNHTPQNVVFYHGECNDGFTAAWCAWKKFGNDAIYEPCFYGVMPQADIQGKDLYILDFSFEPIILEEFLKKTKRLALLDHHKSAFDKLKQYKECFFDMNRSGAGIAWDYFFPGEPRPLFVNYVEDSDLFRFSFPQTRPFIFGFRANEQTFERFNQYQESQALVDHIISEGLGIEKYYMREVDYLADTLAKPCVINNQTGLIANCPRTFTSELGHKLATLPSNAAGWAIVWSQRSDHISCSIRSRAGVDCSQIAMQFGGGGHPQISAFRLKDLKELQEKLGV